MLHAIAAVPREAFVAPELRARAWENAALPIAQGQTISQPTVVARMCELLELSGGETVLDVGTGSGYHAAVLARLVARVVSIERHPALAQRAAEVLVAAGAPQVELVTGDGTLGYPPAAPYDAINVAAAAGAIPAALTEQLAYGGRLVIPLVTDEGQHLVLVRRRREDGQLERTDREPVRFVPLIGGPSD